MHSFDKFKKVLLASGATIATLAVLGCPTSITRTPAPVAPCVQSPSGGAAGGKDTPIYIGGGATTFYLNEKDQSGNFKDWLPTLPTKSNQYCAVVSNASQAILEHSDGAPSVTLFTGQSTWSMTLATASNTLGVSAGTDLCGKGTGEGVQVVVNSTGDKTGFYDKELLPKKHTRRFKDARSTACASDQDSCERVTSVTYGANTYVCSNLNCGLFIGAPPSATATP